MTRLKQFDFSGRPSLGELREAAHGAGCFYACHPLFPASRCDEALTAARAFFSLAPGVKQDLAIERSPHFRGYSVMQNSRDWREQIHFGREEAAPGSQPPRARLAGPNLWPPDALWRRLMLALIDDMEQAASDILAALAASLEIPRARFLPAGRTSYLLLKLIHYPTPPGSAPRLGVAPHVDFSWITVLLQDDTGGLEIRMPDGTWIPAPPVPGALVVNTGEIIEFATRGCFGAAPHRVVNGAQPRVSLPFFLNPALDAEIEALSLPGPFERFPEVADGHVHRVFSKPPDPPFVFGDEEWRRKGLGVFCASCPPSPPRQRVV